MLTIFIVPQDQNGRKLSKFLTSIDQNFNFNIIQQKLRKGEIFIEGRKAKEDIALAAGDAVEIYGSKPIPGKNKVNDAAEKLASSIPIIYKDENIIVINKPSGLASQGGTGIKISAEDLLPFLNDCKSGARLVHRLDRETSGLLLIARNYRTATDIFTAFKARLINKTYYAITVSVPKNKEGVIDFALSKKGDRVIVDDPAISKSAITHYRVIECLTYRNRRLALIELKPKTGRTHQLRAHLSAINCPILGDKKYDPEYIFANDPMVRRLHLHAAKLDLHCIKPQLMLEIPLPSETIPWYENAKTF